jgi:hypothetical protein
VCGGAAGVWLEVAVVVVACLISSPPPTSSIFYLLAAPESCQAVQVLLFALASQNTSPGHFSRPSPPPRLTHRACRHSRSSGGCTWRRARRRCTRRPPAARAPACGASRRRRSPGPPTRRGRRPLRVPPPSKVSDVPATRKGRCRCSPLALVLAFAAAAAAGVWRADTCIAAWVRGCSRQIKNPRILMTSVARNPRGAMNTKHVRSYTRIGSFGAARTFDAPG